MANHVRSLGLPVADVLQRIQVRDPNRNYVPGYQRRMEDLEVRWTAPTLTGGTLFAIVLVGLITWLFPMRKPLRNESKPSVSAMAATPAAEVLEIPAGLHPAAPITVTP